MQQFIRHFKLAAIVTAVAMVLMIVLGLIGVSMIAKEGGRNANERAAKLGSGLATFTGILVAPFWIYGAYKMGKERRAGIKQAMKKNSKVASPRKKSTD